LFFFIYTDRQYWSSSISAVMATQEADHTR